MDIDVFPNTVEYWGPNGMVFFRNIQLRWTPWQKGDSNFMVAIERPGASGSGGAYSDFIALQNIQPRFPAPDFSAHYRYSSEWGHFQIAGIVREIKWHSLNPVPVDLSGSAVGWGVNLSSNIKVSKEKVVIKTDWMDTERTVYLDSRTHPAPTQTFLHGHSVGHWEGKTLVVDTTNFKDHRSGLAAALPSSTKKKLTERFELSEDGKTLMYSGTVEDPVYLSAPGQFSASLEYRPTMPFSNQKCDVQIARSFMKDLPTK